MNNFPDINNNPFQHLVAAQMFFLHNNVPSKPLEEPSDHQDYELKEKLLRAVRKMGTFLVKLGSKLEQVSQEPFTQPKW